MIFTNNILAVRKCSRFQFECRSTSECIAIYNACDGIPQCADGSDEDPELECPNNLVTRVAVMPTKAINPADFIKYDNKVGNQNNTKNNIYTVD